MKRDITCPPGLQNNRFKSALAETLIGLTGEREWILSRHLNSLEEVD